MELAGMFERCNARYAVPLKGFNCHVDRVLQQWGFQGSYQGFKPVPDLFNNSEAKVHASC